MTFDAIVIGGGAAGLAAARDLGARGLGVAVLEARDRLGGLILTMRESGGSIPIELGAEFVHGDAESTFAVADAARLTVDEIFIAGEATSVDETGTVAGAIASGQRAARSALRVLGSSAQFS